MRAIILFAAASIAIACSSSSTHMVDSGNGSGSGSGNLCMGSAYDPCTTNDQCTSMNCHPYSASGFTVCTQACTPGDNTTCPLDSTGAHGTCNNMGNCKPAQANSCTR